MSKTGVVQIEELDLNLFVRAKIDEDWMFQIALGYEAKEPIPPIVLASDGKRVVDGRHRIAARQYLGLKDINATVRPDLVKEEDIVAAAFRANRGGSKPPTAADIEHTIEILIEDGVGVRRIGELLELASTESKTYIKAVQSRLARQRLQKALDAVSEGGMTLAQAAEQFGIPREKLKEAVQPGKKSAAKEGLSDFKRRLTRVYKSYSSTSWRLLEDVIEKYEDGILSANKVREVFKHLEAQQKRAGRMLANYTARFTAKVTSDEEAA